MKIQKDLLRMEAEKVVGHVRYSLAPEVLGEMRKIIDRAKVANRE